MLLEASPSLPAAANQAAVAAQAGGKKFVNKTWISKVDVYIHEKSAQKKKNSVGPDDFMIVEHLGKGAFGQVYLVKKKDTGLQYAMKILDKEKFISKNLVKYAKTERNVLKVMRHPFIVSLNFAF
jgi:protein-serine/threonine kinase